MLLRGMPLRRMPLSRMLLSSVSPTFALLVSSFAVHASDAASTPTTATETRRVAVELTFLKSNPGERDNLIRAVERNWFEMDRIAKKQGLMDDYTVLAAADEEGAWNVLVMVTYRDDRGYAGIREAFEKIRGAHTEIPIDGKRLRDLGAIVESKTTYKHRPAAARAEDAN
jgi:hypothetical protein